MAALRARLEALRGRAADESGFTLIELLVTISISVVVLIALFAYQDVALRQTNSIFTRVDATQTARNTLANVQRELSTACLSETATPVLPGSTETSISFINAYGAAALPTPTKHVIALSNPSGVGTLTDTTYEVSGGTAPTWSFSTTASGTRQLASRAAPVGSTPVFQYFAYDIARDGSGNAYLDSSGNAYKMLLDGSATLPGGVTTSSGAAVADGTVPANSPTPLSASGAGGLSATDAAKVAAIKVSLRIGSSGGGNINTNTSTSSNPIPNTVDVSNQVTLRLTPSASDSSSLAVGPCK